LSGDTLAYTEDDAATVVEQGVDNAGVMTLTNINEDDFTSAGNTVANIVLSAGGDRITDVDAAAVEGIAVTGVDDTNGTWQYDAGSGWTLSVP